MRISLLILFALANLFLFVWLTGFGLWTMLAVAAVVIGTVWLAYSLAERPIDR